MYHHFGGSFSLSLYRDYDGFRWILKAFLGEVAVGECGFPRYDFNVLKEFANPVGSL